MLELLAGALAEVERPAPEHAEEPEDGDPARLHEQGGQQSDHTEGRPGDRDDHELGHRAFTSRIPEGAEILGVVRVGHVVKPAARALSTDASTSFSAAARPTHS